MKAQIVVRTSLLQSEGMLWSRVAVLGDLISKHYFNAGRFDVGIFGFSAVQNDSSEQKEATPILSNESEEYTG